MIRVIFWGTRGSSTTPGPETLKYGGNTPCVELIALPHQEPGYLQGSEVLNLLLDGGTGIIEQIPEQTSRDSNGGIHILLTHHHWDHVMGLPFYAPLHTPDNRVSFYGKSSVEVQASIERLFASVYSPLKGVDNVRGELSYHAVNGKPSAVNGFVVHTTETSHGAPALSYRIEHGEEAVVYTPDHEAGIDSVVDSRLIESARKAELWILNGHFNQKEKKTRVGWGHSSHLEAVELALRAEVKTLAIFHHNPDHDDEMLDQMNDEVQTRINEADIEVVMSKDRMVMDVVSG